MNRWLGILTMNIGNPSVNRAERQLKWLATRPEQLLVLTETCDSAGSGLIAQRFVSAGWDVRFLRPGASERGVLIAARVMLDARRGDLTPYLPARAELTTLAGGTVDIVGLYVPSRDGTAAKIERKQRFIAAVTRALAARDRRPAVLVGDLNVLEPTHRPRRHEFLDWEYAFYEGLRAAGWEDAYRLVHPERMEYSWVGPDEDGYRFDHVFVTRELSDSMEACGYLHETRELGLTDHSAMSILLSGVTAEPLDVDASLTREHRALF
jgi:exodeoxyribonuclease-3